MKPTDVLRQEHEVILRALDALESIAQEARSKNSLDMDSAGDALEFLKTFADRCHHGKEEDILFPELAKHGLPLQVGPLAVMLEDHKEGRRLRGLMTAAYDDARAAKPSTGPFATAAMEYVDLMRDHISKENGVLFPMADGMLSPGEQLALEERFERMEHLDMGEHVHERELDRIERLCARRGIVAREHVTAHAGGCCGHKKSC